MRRRITLMMTGYKDGLGAMGNWEILLVALMFADTTGLVQETAGRLLYAGIGGFLAGSVCLWAVLFRRVRVTASAREQRP